MSLVPATSAPFNAQAEPTLQQQAAAQLAHALTSASLDRELVRLQPLIDDAYAQLRDAHEAQVAAAATCEELRCEVRALHRAVLLPAPPR
jgi:hypothetical protein